MSKAIFIIAKKELATFFDSFIAYIMLVLFLGFSGFFTWLYGNDIFLVGQASLRVFFGISSWTLFFFIPAITMRMLAEEINTGTIELLLTKSISDRDVVIGKFIASLALVSIALVATLPYVITIANIGNLDNGGTICGYLALFFMSMVYCAIGIFASSVTKNQIVAFMMALFIGLFFHIIFGVLASNFTGLFGNILNELSLITHFSSISRGVIDSKDIVYFLSISGIALFLAESALNRRHLSN